LARVRGPMSFGPSPSGFKSTLLAQSRTLSQDADEQTWAIVGGVLAGLRKGYRMSGALEQSEASCVRESRRSSGSLELDLRSIRDGVVGRERRVSRVLSL
jgi:hypothetical protein